MKINPLLESDFYKQVHCRQYSPDIAKIVSYMTPRMSRLKDQNFVIVFGIQSLVIEKLIEDFKENFFERKKEDLMKEVQHILDNTINCDCDIERYEKLYDLGYLPIEIKALPEGTKCPIGVPFFEISNTHPDFAWLTNALESMISCEIWHAMVCANIGYKYREIVNYWYNKTCDDFAPKRKALGDFSMRGQESTRSAYKSSAAWLISHVNTATVPAIPYLEQYYNCNCELEEVGFGSPSTEHSVMCSNYSLDGDEITGLKRLLTEVYPNSSFSVVSDSYDYWNFVKKLLPKCRKEIENHNGTLLIRGDSGDPVEVVTKTVFELAEIFGTTMNNKGYKVLNPKIKAIYGDSITIQRAQKIYEILERKGFAANNVVLGVGSFSMQCLEDSEGKLNPFTRDTFGMAIKATHMIMKNGEEHFIFKNPKESTFKKSHKGCCVVMENSNGMYVHDEVKFEDTYSELNRFKTIFKDGKMVKEYSLKEIRDRLWDNKFYE